MIEGFVEFVTESNRIEGIERSPSKVELDATFAFVNLHEITLSDIKALVATLEPGAVIRDQVGMDIHIGNYFPPIGGPDIPDKLQDIVDVLEFRDAYYTHLGYEKLHPFTDGNGRSGRAIWLWQMGVDEVVLRKGFLHMFYYQVLSHQP